MNANFALCPSCVEQNGRVAKNNPEIEGALIGRLLPFGESPLVIGVLRISMYVCSRCGYTVSPSKLNLHESKEVVK